MKYIHINILALFILVGCVQAQKKQTINDFEFIIKYLKEIPISDSKPYLAEIINIKFKNSKHYFIYDSRSNIKEFINNHAVGIIGSRGRGQCEYQSVNNFVVQGNKLYLIDRTLGKFLRYNLTSVTNKKCFEMFDKALVGLSGIEILDDKLFFIKGNLVNTMKTSTPIIYTFTKQIKKLEATDIQLGDLNIELSKSPLLLSMASDSRDGKFYFYLPLTKKIFIYQPATKKLNNFKIDIYVGADKGIYNPRSLRKMLQLVSNKIEIVFDIFALKKVIVVGYRKGTGKDQIWKLAFYSYQGQKLGEKIFDNRVVYMQNKKLMTLDLNLKGNNPYSFRIYEYSF